MLRSLRFFFRDPLIRYPAALTAVLIAVQVVVLTRSINQKGEPIFLHYTTYFFGVDFVGAPYLAYLLPGVSFIVGALNFGLASIVGRRDKLLGYVLVCGSAMVAALLLIQAVLLSRLNS